MQAELGSAIRSVDPENAELKDGTLKGDLHRTWMDIRDPFTATDEAAMLAECKRGESFAPMRSMAWPKRMKRPSRSYSPVTSIPLRSTCT